MDTSLTIDRIAGHRLWRVIPHPVDGDPALASVAMPGVWQKPEQIAVCVAEHLTGPASRPRPVPHPGERIPVLDCTCGLYAGTERVTPSTRGMWAQGPVEMWGRVIEGTRGFRAERLRIAGDLDLVIGMGPGRPRCTRAHCRSFAVGVAAPNGVFAARCRAHGSGVDLASFEATVSDVFRRRYGVRARLLSEVASG